MHPMNPLYLKKNICDWSSGDRNTLIQKSASSTSVSVSKVRWREQEDEVYLHFVIRGELGDSRRAGRTNCGRRSDDQWIER